MAGAARDLVLIGVDGGATEVKACAVGVDADGLLAAAAQGVALRHEPAAGFAALPLAEQLAGGALGAAERAQGEAWVRATARAIVATAAGARAALIGVALPGLKTRDGRGVAAALHGPRIPDFLDQLERELAREGPRLAAPVAGLFGDGVCAGWGEELGRGGLFRGVRDAYYLGAGTGLSECWKFGGAISGPDEVEERLPKAWRLGSAGGASFEELLSASALQRRLPGEGFAEERAARGDPEAIEALRVAGEALAELVDLRARALASWSTPVHLARVVLGQRLRDLADPERSPLLATARAALDRRLAAGQDARRVREPIELCLSSLREAPALGAAALAWRAFGGRA